MTLKNEEFLYAQSIHHDGSRRYVRSPGGDDPDLGDVVTIRLRAAPDAPIERVLLYYRPDGEGTFIEMLPEAAENPAAACRWWRARLSIGMLVTNYRFLLFTEDGVWWYNGRGLQRHDPTDADDFHILAGYAAPNWARRSVFYQIFPDRFADGDPGNNVRDGEFEYRGAQASTRRWGQPPRTTGWESSVEFYGGDLAGIEKRLDYLEDLGVNALYINPVFTAYSNHRYDVVDFEHVDPHLGGDRALASLRAATAVRGFRMLLDIVPNHCGFMHPWFQDACADPKAPSAEFFTFQEHPDEYSCWLGHRSLPKLNYRSQALRDVMYAASDAIFRRWLRLPYAVDGWRIDVANMLARQGAYQMDLEIGRGIRQAVKEENPQAYLLAESFFDSSSQLQGDIWDATMNYPGFSTPLWHWLNRFSVDQQDEPKLITSEVPWPTQALVDTWEAYRASLPWAISRQQFNLLGSHDTERILPQLGGNLALNRLAAGFMMTYVGVPSIYYGDEIGMQGEGKHTRACMIWDEENWDQDLRAFYQALIRLRRSSTALMVGGFQVLMVEENTLAYMRDAEDEQVIVIGHRGPDSRPTGSIPVGHGAITNGTEFEEVFSHRRATVVNGRLPVSGMSTGIEIWQTRP